MMDSTLFVGAVMLIALILICIPAIYFVIISTIADRVHGVRPAPAPGGFAVLPAKHETKLRFAILHHTGVVPEHYDLLFETAPGSSLATWRSPAWPIVSQTPVERLDDHRRDYLDYQGPVSNNRGEVRRIASGHCTVDQTDPNRWVISTDDGLRLTLRRIPPSAAWIAEVGQTI